jgi:Domain of unknown function (DUF222)
MFYTDLPPPPEAAPPEEIIDCLVEDELGTAEPVRWSEYVPDGLLADMLTHPAETGPEHREFESLERIGAWDRVVAWAQAGQLREISSFMRSAQARNAALGASTSQAHDSAVAEVGLMLRVSTRTAASRVDDAWSLCTRLPGTLAALQQGRITLAKARVLDAETTSLSREHAAQVEQQVLTKARQQTPGQLRAATRRAVHTADPAAAQRRAEQARRERGVRMWPEPDGMATLSAYLPAEDATGVFAVLDEHARRAKGIGDERTLEVRRGDALVDLVLSPTGHCSAGTRAAREATVSQPSNAQSQSSNAQSQSSNAQSQSSNAQSQSSNAQPQSSNAQPQSSNDQPQSTQTQPSNTQPHPTGTQAQRGNTQESADESTPAAHVTNAAGCRCECGRCRRGGGVDVRVTVPLTTLLGANDLPGELAGYGPIPAAVARDLAAGGTWRRILTDPASGRPLDYGTTRYRPPAHLAELVITRDQTCQFPGCRVPAHLCDIDHGIPYDPAAGTGPTSETNLGPKCRCHHQVKQTPGWSVTHHPDGCTTWATPSGHLYHSQPPPLTDPEPLTTRPAPHSDEPPPF